MEHKHLGVFELDSNYSTTQKVSLTPPIIINMPDDKFQSDLFLPENSERNVLGGLRTQGYYKNNESDNPLISIITVVFNGEKYLEQTIKSVIGQNYNNIEYIVIDGGSTDSTVNIIKKYQNKIDYWMSEPDKGIADAMNKGLCLATGEFIVFIHADDYFVDSNVIKKAVDFLNKNNHIFIFKVFFDNGMKKTVSANKKFGFLTNFKMGSCHQGHICSRYLFESIGLFDTEFKIAMDYDLILRAYRAGFSTISIDLILSTMRLVGISSRRDWKGLKERFNEERKAHIKNTQNFWQHLFYSIYWPNYIQYRKIRYFLNNVPSKLLKLS